MGIAAQKLIGHPPVVLSKHIYYVSAPLPCLISTVSWPYRLSISSRLPFIQNTSTLFFHSVSTTKKKTPSYGSPRPSGCLLDHQVMSSRPVFAPCRSCFDARASLSGSRRGALFASRVRYHSTPDQESWPVTRSARALRGNSSDLPCVLHASILLFAVVGPFSMFIPPRGSLARLDFLIPT